VTAFPDADPVVTPVPAGPHTVCLAVTGDLDYGTCNELIEQVYLALCDRDDVRELRLDCREAGLVDSMGLSALLQVRRSTGRDGIGFHLDNVGPALRRLLELTGTHEYLSTPRQHHPATSRRNQP
jgi:anti-anti-sigma factor